MAASPRQDRIATLIDHFNNRRFADYAEGFHECAVIEYPQSGERVHGRQRIQAMLTAFAAPPTFHAWRIDGGGDLVMLHAAAHYPGPEPLFAVIEFQFDGALVARETAYFASSFPAPDWRRPFVEVRGFV
ncbi:MAG: hypothetical protein FJ318_08620 [SAR202 cluster bacterium]|nr:hypothetical protein [SAR202 cluster bacterium]